jgi:hypothetical protein
VGTYVEATRRTVARVIFEDKIYQGIPVQHLSMALRVTLCSFQSLSARYVAANCLGQYQAAHHSNSTTANSTPSRCNASPSMNP